MCNVDFGGVRKPEWKSLDYPDEHCLNILEDMLIIWEVSFHFRVL